MLYPSAKAKLSTSCYL